MKKIFITTILLSLGIFINTSFKLEDKPTFSKEEMKNIQIEIEERINAFTKKQQADCWNALMEKVDAKVDTILMFEIEQLLIGDDSLYIPQKPDRPQKPQIMDPIDSLPLAPLIENEKDIFNKENSEIPK